jgi:DNA-binding protein H-NS
MTDLSKMSLADMRALREQLSKEIKAREQQEIAKAREQIKAIAQSVGVPLKELFGDGGRSRADKSDGKVPVRYRHPSDTSLHWTGRGRQPQWVKDWLSSGKPLDALRV